MSEDIQSPPNLPGSEAVSPEQPPAPGENVRVHDEEGQPDDSWQYQGRDEETGAVIVTRIDPDKGEPQHREVAEDDFWIWQQEKLIVAEHLREEERRALESSTEKTPNKVVSAFRLVKNATKIAKALKRIKASDKTPESEPETASPAGESVDDRQSEPEVISESAEPADGPEEIIKEDTEENWTESSDARQSESAYLRKSGVNEAKIAEVSEILDKDLAELVHLHLSNIGVEKEKIEDTAQLLVPRKLYLKRLHELGMPVEKDEEAHKFLVEEVGRLRFNHLAELVGGKKEELRELLRTHHQDLLAAELKELGFDDEKIREISSTPRRDKSKLIQEALKNLGLEDETIKGVEKIAALAEIPPEIAENATRLEIPLEILVKAREAFRRADWGDTLDYLKLAQRHSGARERLKLHGIEIKPTETEGEKLARLENMTLKNINEAEPGEWEAERVRRMARKKEELKKMLAKFGKYLPLKELPLPDDVEVPPEEKIPDDPKDRDDILAAYGLWRRLLVDSYTKRIGNEKTYKSVRAELHRVGGRLPIMRKVRQRWLAIRILQNQKREAREQGIRGNFGAFGIGISKYGKNFRAVENADIKVQNARRALNHFHKQDFVSDGQATPRKRLAEDIVAIRLLEIAFREGKLNPQVPHAGGPHGEKVTEHEELVV